MVGAQMPKLKGRGSSAGGPERCERSDRLLGGYDPNAGYSTTKGSHKRIPPGSCRRCARMLSEHLMLIRALPPSASMLRTTVLASPRRQLDMVVRRDPSRRRKRAAVAQARSVGTRARRPTAARARGAINPAAATTLAQRRSTLPAKVDDVRRIVLCDTTPDSGCWPVSTPAGCASTAVGPGLIATRSPIPVRAPNLSDVSKQSGSAVASKSSPTAICSSSVNSL